MIQVKEFLCYKDSDINKWLKENQGVEIVEIKYSVGCFQEDSREFSGCLIIYKIKED